MDSVKKKSSEEKIIQYRKYLHRHIEILFAESDEASSLKEVCKDALQGGKCFRPILVLLVAKALGKEWEVMDAAISVEFFHTASLIADDLPCMDNSDLRRGKTSTHKKYGESTALLSAFSLIAMGYQLVQKNGSHLLSTVSSNSSSDFSHVQEYSQRILLALENCAETTGIEGIQMGQYLDLFPAESIAQDSVEIVYDRIIRKKTVPLFENAFVLGWLFGGGKLSLLPQVKQASSHFGFAFQLADDLQDQREDEERCKSNGQNYVMNAASLWGREKAIDQFFLESKKWQVLMHELALDSSEMLSTMDAVSSLVASTV